MSRSLQTLNGQNKLAQWSARIQECRSSGMSVKNWCAENGVCEQTYYKWQRRLFELSLEQQEVQFAEVTPAQAKTGKLAATVKIGKTEAEIYNGADASTVEMLLRIISQC